VRKFYLVRAGRFNSNFESRGSLRRMQAVGLADLRAGRSDESLVVTWCSAKNWPEASPT